jgi:hypothetical protein
MTPRTTRIVLGVVTPAAVLFGSLLAGVAVVESGCTNEETTQVESVDRPVVLGHLSESVSRYAKDDVGRGRDGQSAHVYANTLLPGVASARTAGADSTLEKLFGNGVDPTALAAYGGLCPPDMASIDDRYCVDKYEASLVEVLADGTEQPYSPYEMVKGHVVRAISEPNVYPQGYISEVEAIQACALSGKRLCKAKEWRQACMGPEHKTYGYGNKSEPGKCNDSGRSPMTALYAGENLAPRGKWNWDRMNRPELNQVEGTLAHTGEHDGCTNGYGVYDMVGNLHEWVDDPKGTFQGGYYQDTSMNGEGCGYVTTAHEARYHDYSTGFRCCADVAP